MKSVSEELHKLGISHVPITDGEHRTQCPKCSSARRKKRQRCLTVKIDADGSCGSCWHCGWTFGFSLRGERTGFRAVAPLKPSDFGASARRLRNHLFP